MAAVGGMTEKRGGGIVTEMNQLVRSMEETMKLQNRAMAERRARRAERKKKEFQEKLRQAAVNSMEVDGMASRAKGSEAAVQRDQLMAMMQ